MILTLLSYTTTILLVTNLVCFFIIRKKYTLPVKIFTIYLFVIVIIQVSTKIMASYKINNLVFTHYYFIGQFFLLSLFFRSILNTKKITKAIDIVIILVLPTICIYYLIHPHKYFEFNNFEIALTSIPLIIYCFLFIIKKIDQKDKTYFYLVSGLFIYLAGSTLLFSTGNIKMFSPMKKVVWFMNMVLYLIYQILIFIEWYKNFRKKNLVVIANNNESAH